MKSFLANYNFKYKTLAKYIVLVYYGIALLRSSTHLILQCAFLRLHESSINETNLVRKEIIDSKLEYFKDFMLIIGQIHRGSGANGVFFYSICFSGTIIFLIFGNIFSERVFNHTKSNRFILFLKNYKSEQEQINLRIDGFINYIIHSNVNFRIAITGLVNENQNKLIYSRIMENSTVDKDKFSGRTSLKSINSSSYVNLDQSNSTNSILRKGGSNVYKFEDEQQRLLQQNKTNNDDNFNHNPIERYLLNALSRQLNFLIELRYSKKRVWPQNRLPHLIPKWKRRWCNIFFPMLIMTYAFSQVCCIIGYSLANNSLLNSNLEEKYKKFNLSDRIALADYHLFVLCSTEAFIIPPLILAFSVCDQLENMKLIKFKLFRLCERIKRHELILQEQIKNELNFSPLHHPVNYKDIRLYEQERRDLQFECDKEALELYILYQISRKELKSVVKLAECLANQNLIFLAISIIPSLFFFKHITEHGLSILVIVLALIIICMNCFLCICAALQKSCSQLSKYAKLFVTFSEGNNHQMYLANLKQFKSRAILHSNNSSTYGQQQTHADTSIDNTTFKRTTTTTIQQDQTKTMLDIDFNYYSHGYITPHTLLLWRRLTEIHDASNNEFVCKLYNMFELTYCGVLKLNYWFISIALYILTDKR